jgi:hypothetical protein
MTGYKGGDGEPQLVQALEALLTAEETDAVASIKNRYWVIGSIIEIAQAHGYMSAMGLKGWMYLHFRRGETHARECLQCWRDRDTFDRAYAWWRTGNTEFAPSKLSGPRFSNELCKAYRARLTGTRPKRTGGMTAKQLRELLAVYRSGFPRVAADIRKRAAQDGGETLVLNAVEREIAEAEAESDGDDTTEVPIDATRDTAPGFRNTEPEPDTEPDQHPGGDPDSTPDPDPDAEPDPEPEPDPTPDPEPEPESDPEFVPYPDGGQHRLTVPHIGPTELVGIEKEHGLTGWRGHQLNRAARQLRGDFLFWQKWTSHSPIPAHILQKDADWWIEQQGKLAADVMAS